MTPRPNHPLPTASGPRGAGFLWVWAAFFFGMLYALLALGGLGFIAHGRIALNLADYRPARFEVTELYRPGYRGSRGVVMLYGTVRDVDGAHPQEALTGESALLLTGAASMADLDRHVRPGQVLEVWFDPTASAMLYQGLSQRVVHTDAALHRARWATDETRLVPLVAWLLFCLWKALPSRRTRRRRA